MKHADEYIKEIFSQKLGNYESAVRPELWNNIASQLPSGGAAARGSASGAGSTATLATKAISTKLIWIAAVAAITVASVVTYAVLDKEPATNEQPSSTANPTAPPAQEAAATTSDSIYEVNETTAVVEKNNTQPSASTTVADGSTVQQSIAVQQPASAVSPAKDAPVVITTPSPTATPAPSSTSSPVNAQPAQPGAPLKHAAEEEKELLTAHFNIASVNKEELRFFFMPQYTAGETYLWDFGDGTTSTDRSPMHSFGEEGVHQVTLTVTDAQGHQELYTYDVAAYLPAFIDVPNIFTPNGDGLNDTFDVLEKSRNITLQKTIVFSNDRIVFETDDNRLWDGNDQQGNPLPQGEYKFYISALDKEGNKLEKKGYVTLRR